MKPVAIRVALLVAAAVPLVQLGLGAADFVHHRTPVRISRIFTGPDMLTHADEYEVKLTKEGTGTAVREVSAKVAATAFEFHRNPPVFFSDFHVAPRHYYVFNLNGREDFELSDGTILPHYPGHILEPMDFTGKGHVSNGLGVEDRIALFVTLAAKQEGVLR